MAEGLLQTARAVSEAALATPGVHALSVGTLVEVATYEGGDKVSGVVVGDREVEVHVVLNYPLAKPIPQIARDIEDKVSPSSGGRKVEVVVEDLADDAEGPRKEVEG